MTIPPPRRLLLTAALTGLVLCGAIGWIWAVQIPALNQARAEIDTKRAAITVKQEEQRNFATVKKNLETLDRHQKKLLDEIWSFDTEETFYARWTGLAAESQTVCDEPKISDATPGKAIQTRTISGACRGTLTAVLTALNRLQTVLPAIIINRAVITKSADTPDMILSFDAVSLWR